MCQELLRLDGGGEDLFKVFDDGGECVVEVFVVGGLAGSLVDGFGDGPEGGLGGAVEDGDAVEEIVSGYCLLRWAALRKFERVR
jgi:hypothetical protein